MRRTRSVGTILALLAAALPLACGDTHDDPAGTNTRPAASAPAARPAASDDALARAARLRLADMPDGWDTQPVPARVRCGRSGPLADARVLLETPRLVLDKLGVQEEVAVFASEDASRRAYVRINRQKALACLRRNARDQMSAEAGGRATPLTVVRSEPLARWEHATRFLSTAPSSIGRVSGYIDAVHLRVGRTLGALLLVSTFRPLDSELYEDVLARFERRLRGAAG